MDIIKDTIMDIIKDTIRDTIRDTLDIIKDITLGKLRASMDMEVEEVTPQLFTETEEMTVLDSALALGQGCIL